MEVIRKDVIVVGLGAFGSAALWRLAERGAEVAGLERYDIGHHFGSSHGGTRLFRLACQEHPGLAATALKSLELWTELGERVGERLVHQTGCLSVGAPDTRAVKGTLATAAAAGLPVSQIDHKELVAGYPQYSGLTLDDVGIWDPGGGICYPERNVHAHAVAAQQLGTEIYAHTMAVSIEASRDGITVRTPTVEYRSPQVIVSAGPWLGKLVPSLQLAPRRTPQYWFRPRDPDSDAFSLESFPAFIWQRSDGEHFWGHGSDEGFGIKIGPGRAERLPTNLDIDPDEMDRYIHMDSDVDEAASAVAQAFPDLHPRPAKVIPCVVTDSPDGQFIVGRLVREPRVIVAGGDSSHGFKHAAGIGELLAQITAGERPYCETAFLDPARFS